MMTPSCRSRNAEVAQIDDRRDVQTFKLGKRLIGKLPIVATGPRVRCVVRRTETEIFDAEVADRTSPSRPRVWLSRREEQWWDSCFLFLSQT
jgi:hypothetical protein